MPGTNSRSDKSNTFLRYAKVYDVLNSDKDYKEESKYIDYYIDLEESYLIDNAYVNYDFTELNAGEIFVDWENNFLEFLFFIPPRDFLS